MLGAKRIATDNECCELRRKSQLWARDLETTPQKRGDELSFGRLAAAGQVEQMGSTFPAGEWLRHGVSGGNGMAG